MVAATRTFAVEITRGTSAPPARLFALATDGARWPDWAGPLIRTGRMEREGDPAPGGVGAVRAVGAGPVLVREETLEYEQDRRHTYAMRTKGPMRDYVGELTLVPRDGGGTDIVWRATFVETLPFSGPAVRAVVRLILVDLATRLARFAER